MMRVRPFILTLVLLACVVVPRSTAQPGALGDTIRIIKIDTSGFPTIRVHVRAFCKGTQLKDLTSVAIDVVDQGVSRQYNIGCPIETVPMSVALCVDRSGSVAGTTLYRIQQGAWQFVQLMQSHTAGSDEAALISFNERIGVDIPMTTDIGTLFGGIDQLYGMGNTALWDAVMLAIHEAANGTNAIKAVVLLSDGGDNSSGNTLPDVINYARIMGIPVYTLCLMYHAAPEEVGWMKALADSTGGQFRALYSPNDIIAAFNAIASDITGGANDCIIEYKIECPDGGMRTATVTATACGKTVTETIRYRAPRDPTLPSVTVRFDSSSAYENGDLYIPVMIYATGAETDVSELAFKILRQDSVVFHRAIIAGHFAEHFTVDSWQDSDTLLFTLKGSAKLSGSDTLMVLHFKAGSFPKDSVLPLQLFYFDKKTSTCMLLNVTPCNYTVLKRPVLGMLCMDTVHVHWDKTQSMYAPNVLVFSTRVANASPISARNTRAWIEMPYGMRLESGLDTVFLSNPLIRQGESELVTFYAQILPTDTARDYVVCINIKSDSGAVTTCCVRVLAEPAKPALRCALTMPAEVRWSDSARSYIPASFPVTLTLRNPSPVPARSVAVHLAIPPGFSAPSNPPLQTLLTPDLITQRDTASLTWIITPLDRMNGDSVTFCVYASSATDSTVCCQTMFITSTPVRATVACGNPRVVKYDEEKNTWDPPQFLASTTVRNISGIDMAQAQGRITLPPFLTLAAGENVQKDLPNGALLKPGDSTTLSWTLIGSKAAAGTYQICIDILASNFPGARCCVPLIVQTNEAAPVLACALGGPDSIFYRNGGYEPNPFVLSLGVQNLGTSPAKKVYGALLQGADLSIDGSDQALKLLTDSLAGGENVNSSFTVRVLDRSVSRVDTIRVTVYAANGGAVVCEKYVWIEAVRGPAVELTCSGPDSLVFSDSLDAYVPTPFLFSITGKNVGTAPADSVVAEFLPPPDVTLASGEQSAKLLTPSTLNVGQSGAASWLVTVMPRSAGRIDTLRAQVRSHGTSIVTTQPCLVPLYVPRRRSAALDIRCASAGPIGITGGKYDPDPFAITVTLTNNGDARAFDVAASLLIHGRLQPAPGDSLTRRRAALDANGGSDTFTWKFTATPQQQGDSVEVCFRISALRQNDLYCCTKIWLPPLPPAGIDISCGITDTVRFDIANDRYPNPITLRSTVTNTSSVTVDSVRATVILPQGLQLAAGETSDKSILNIAPAQQAPLQWQLDVLRDTSTVAKARSVRIQYYRAGSISTCDATVIVLPPPPKANDTTAFELSCSSPDTIHFVNPQIGLQPNPFTVRADIHNTGTTPLEGITATLQLPSGVELGSGETVTKSFGGTLAAGQTATITWSCVPGASEVPISGVIEVRINATGVVSQSCRSKIFIQRVYRVVQLLIPRGNLVREGELVSVPVVFTNPSLAVVTSYRFGVRFDPATVRIEGHSTANTLSNGWTVTSGTPEAGHFLVSGSSNVPLNGSGTVVVLNVRALSGDGTRNTFGWKLSDLILDSIAFPKGVEVDLQHGDIVTSAECLLPLKGSTRFVLRPNHPNPAHPVTTITYVLDADPVPVQIDIVDPFGRVVRRFDEGVRQAGEHRITWDASGLPEGVYYCHLMAGGQAVVRAILVAR